MLQTEMSQVSCLTTVCHSDVPLPVEYFLLSLESVLLFPKATYKILEGGT